LVSCSALCYVDDQLLELVCHYFKHVTLLDGDWMRFFFFEEIPLIGPPSASRGQPGTP
jgi:hypothetical protein